MDRKEKIALLKAIRSGSGSITDLHEMDMGVFIEKEPGLYAHQGKLITLEQVTRLCRKPILYQPVALHPEVWG